MRGLITGRRRLALGLAAALMSVTVVACGSPPQHRTVSARCSIAQPCAVVGTASPSASAAASSPPQTSRTQAMNALRPVLRPGAPRGGGSCRCPRRTPPRTAAAARRRTARTRPPSPPAGPRACRHLSWPPSGPCRTSPAHAQRPRRGARRSQRNAGRELRPSPSLRDRQAPPATVEGVSPGGSHGSSLARVARSKTVVIWLA